jgi:sigma-E factor negative regulatory protein RseC
MSHTGNVFHQGQVVKLHKSFAEIAIIPQQACGSCHARQFCSLSSSDHKVIEVPVNEKDQYTAGQEVTVVLSSHLGLKAVLLAYFLPFVWVMIVLLSIWSITRNELVAGLSAIAALVPYYLVLRLFKNHLKKVYEFRILS